MANQVAGSQTKLAADVAQLKTDVESLNSNKASYTAGTFTAKLYDYETYIADLSNCHYVKLGNVYVMWYIGNTSSKYSFNAMFQIRNFPCTAVLGGTIYTGGTPNAFGDKSIQASAVGVYLRPNFTGELNAGIFTFMLIGVD